jgi:Aspartyl/Asparaginyl beta-hydroxylase
VTAPIKYIASGFDVDESLREIADHPEYWNQYTMRTEEMNSPHSKVDDIWIRYNDWSNFHGDRIKFNQEHESVWYPCVEKLPSVKQLVMDVMCYVQGERLGGVFITRIPPHESIDRHKDGGWHATYYDKFAVQLIGNQDQAFCFDGTELRADEGDLYTFDNSKDHWVINDSNDYRMTLIITIRGHRFNSLRSI